MGRSIATYSDVKKSSIQVANSSVSKLSATEARPAPTGGGWGCEECKDMVTYTLNAGSCALEGTVACAAITSSTGVGPLACPVAIGIICSIIQNETVTDPENVCGGCDMWGNDLPIASAPCTDCDDCSWWNPLC